MAGVALTIHGVGNRDRAGFEASVSRLADLAGLPPDRFKPVFWGDLGPEGPLQSIPVDADSAVLTPPPGAFDIGPTPELLAAAAAAADATVEHLQTQAGAPVPAETRDALHRGTAEAASLGYSLALSADIAPLLAEVVLTAAPAGTAEVASGAFGIDWAKDRIVSVLGRVNDMLVDLLVRTFRGGEGALGSTLAHTLGDILIYQSRGPEIRGRLDDAYRAASQANPGARIDIVAHSLGALIAVEWLLGASVAGTTGAPTAPEARAVRKLVTFGTQVSLFAEIEGLRRTGDGFGAGAGRQSLAIRVDGWTNVWQELDPLAFVMHRVFDVHPPGAATVVTINDLRLTQEHIPTDLSFHSSYWRDPRFARWLAGYLEA